MVTLLTIQILSIIAAVLTNLIGLLAFATDYWSVIVYDLMKLHSYAKWIVIDEINTGEIRFFNHTNETRLSPSATVVFAMEDNVTLYKTHRGLFRQCNYLSDHIRARFQIPKCRALKTTNNQYDDLIHGMTNPGRELIRLNNVAASCGILIVLLLCTCTFVGITVGILNSVVLATMTVSIIYLVSTLFSIFVVTIMYTIFKSEGKHSHCLALDILTDDLCSARTIQTSYSFLCGCLLIILSFITSVLWLSLQEKQRKFAQH